MIFNILLYDLFIDLMSLNSCMILIKVKKFLFVSFIYIISLLDNCLLFFVQGDVQKIISSIVYIRI